jgi:hypothetical protein
VKNAGAEFAAVQDVVYYFSNPHVPRTTGNMRSVPVKRLSWLAVVGTIACAIASWEAHELRVSRETKCSIDLKSGDLRYETFADGRRVDDRVKRTDFSVAVRRYLGDTAGTVEWGLVSSTESNPGEIRHKHGKFLRAPGDLAIAAMKANWKKTSESVKVEILRAYLECLGSGDVEQLHRMAEADAESIK